MQVGVFVGESRSLGNWEGREHPKNLRVRRPTKLFPCTLRIYGVFPDAEKRPQQHFVLPRFFIRFASEKKGENMKNKKLLIALIALVAVAAVMVGVMIANRPQPEPARTDPDNAKTITVTVVHGNGTEKEFTYKTNEQYLGKLLLDEGLIQGDEGQYGLMIHTVDGEKADWNVDQSYWALFVGQDFATTGVDTTPIHDGDHFRLVYTRG